MESTTLAYGLDFVLLTTKRYDLVIPAEIRDLSAIRTLACWLTTQEAADEIMGVGGYDTHQTGQVEWVD